MRCISLATLGTALAFPAAAAADFTHVEVRDVSDEIGTPAGLRTWRIFAMFTDPFEQVLAVAGDPDSVPVVFETNDPDGLFNDGGPFSGMKLEDFAAAPITPAWDSWVTIGATGLVANCTNYSPGFLNNDGINAVIVGTSWSDSNDGWFDQHLGTAESGPEVAIAQFTVGLRYDVRLSGVIFYIGQDWDIESSVFSARSEGVGPCPADLDLSGEVGADDLLILLASWGACTGLCPPDLDGNDAVEFPDLLALLVAWGPCPQPGACCYPDGSYAQAKTPVGFECTIAGGVYQGLDTTCADVTCPPPAACCFPDGSCAQQFKPRCLASGGVPQGGNTLCTDMSCPQPGACCLPDGSCEQAATLDGAGCISQGGEYQGVDTTCADTQCPIPTACCLNDGACVQRFEQACLASGGVPQGDGTLCADVTCSQPGACCFNNGLCVQAATLGGAACTNGGGMYFGDDTVCVDVVCPVPGACCLPDGTCVFAQMLGGADCDFAGGLYQGDDTDCADADCAELGACCLLDDTCELLLDFACADAGGSFVGQDTICTIDCTRGACCLADGTCFFVTPATCEVLDGVYAGGGIACESVTCP